MVMKFALESHAIVSSFFPQTVRARLFGATGLGMLTGRRKSQMNVNSMNAAAAETTAAASSSTRNGKGGKKSGQKKKRSTNHRKASGNEFQSSGGPEGMTLETGGVDSLSRSSHHKRSNKKQQGHDGGGVQSPKKQLQSLMGTNVPEITVLETPIADLVGTLMPCESIEYLLVFVVLPCVHSQYIFFSCACIQFPNSTVFFAGKNFLLRGQRFPEVPSFSRCSFSVAQTPGRSTFRYR